MGPKPKAVWHEIKATRGTCSDVESKSVFEHIFSDLFRKCLFDQILPNFVMFYSFSDFLVRIIYNQDWWFMVKKANGLA